MTDHALNIQPQRAVIYCRVSDPKQKKEGHGLDSQEHRCRQHAAQKGYDVAAVFPDTITGGGDFMQRPGMVALLAFLDKNPKDTFVVIFDDLKRLARDTRFYLDLRDAFRHRKAIIECLNFNFEDSPEGEFIETIMAAQGALERKQNGRQVAQKMRARMEKGFWVHLAPIGYHYTRTKDRGKMLVPHPPFDAIIREAFEGYACGRFQSQAEVQRFFETCPDFPRDKKGRVSKHWVPRIFSQPVYTGHICSDHYGIHWLPAQHDALISVDTYQKVQDRRKGILATKAPARKNIGEDFALRGFVLCGECATPLRSCWTKGRSKRYPYYLCQNKDCVDYGKSTARDTIETDVGNLLKEIQPSPSLFTLAKAMMHRIWTGQRDQMTANVRAAKRQLKDIETQRDAVLERLLATTNAHVIQAYEAKLAELEKTKAIVTEQAAQNLAPRDTFEKKLEPVLLFLANPWSLWKTGNIAVRRIVLRLTFQDRLKYHRKTGTRTANFSRPFSALQTLYTPQFENGSP